MKGWLTLGTWYHTILLIIGYKSRTCYNVPVVIESRTNRAYYTAPYKPRHEIRTDVARVCRRICSLSKKRPAREVELTGRGCFCDGCHIKHTIREAFPAKKYYYPENVNQNKGTQGGTTKIAKRYDTMVASSTNNWFYVWDIVGQRGRSTYTRIVTLHVCIRSPYIPLCRKTFKK